MNLTEAEGSDVLPSAKMGQTEHVGCMAVLERTQTALACDWYAECMARERLGVRVALLFARRLAKEADDRVEARKLQGQRDAELTKELARSERFASAQFGDDRQTAQVQRRAIRERLDGWQIAVVLSAAMLQQRVECLQLRLTA